ncbi:MAG: PKD domain-containing protein [Bacteroidota bacterium]
MTKIKPLFILIVYSCLLTCCKKKELPENVDLNSPQFGFTGTINGTTINLKAGIDDYYMYSNYTQDNNGVYHFLGNLKKADCVNCPNSIAIEINDHKVSALNGISGADSAFSFKYYPIMSGNPIPILFRASFYSSFNKLAKSYLWDFGDGKSSKSQNPNHVFKGAGKYNVCLTAVDILDCGNSICNTQVIGNIGPVCTASITFSLGGVQTNTINLALSSIIGLPPYQFQWDFGDGNKSTLPTPFHVYAQHGRYPVSLQVVDGKKDTANANYNYVTRFEGPCTVNYFMTSLNAITNPFALSNITIKWTDGEGKVFSSNDLLQSSQPSSSYFKLLKSEDYQNNVNGQKTKKLTIQFSCTVFNGTSSLLIENAQAIIAVGYK